MWLLQIVDLSVGVQRETKWKPAILGNGSSFLENPHCVCVCVGVCVCVCVCVLVCLCVFWGGGGTMCVFKGCPMFQRPMLISSFRLDSLYPALHRPRPRDPCKHVLGSLR